MKNINIAIIICLLFRLFICNYVFADKDKNILESCFSNIREITEAVKKYNKENKEQIHKLHDYNDIFILEKKNYLKEIVKPAPGCNYSSIGDLSSNSFIIFCSIHGDIEHYVYCESFPYGTHEKLSPVWSDELFNNEFERIKRNRVLESEIKMEDSKRLWQKKKKLYVFAILGIIISFTELLRIIYKYTFRNRKPENQ